MKVIVCGSRDFVDRDKAFSTLDYWHARLRISLVIESGQLGAAKLAKDWAIARGIAFSEETASKEDWAKAGGSQAAATNRRMLRRRPERVISFELDDDARDMLMAARVDGVKCIEVA